MKFVPAICPQCNANIQVDEDSQKCFCSFCGVQILVENAIQKIQGTVTIDSVPQLKNYLYRANEFFQEGEYVNANIYYNKALDLDPTNKEGKMGLKKGQAMLRARMYNNQWNFEATLKALTEAASLDSDERISQMISKYYEAIKSPNIIFKCQNIQAIKKDLFKRIPRIFIDTKQYPINPDDFSLEATLPIGKQMRLSITLRSAYSGPYNIIFNDPFDLIYVFYKCDTLVGKVYLDVKVAKKTGVVI